MAKFSEIMQQSAVAKLFQRGNDAAASDEASDDAPPPRVSAEAGAPDDHAGAQVEIVTQPPTSEVATTETVASDTTSDTASSPELNIEPESETVWEDALQMLPKPKPPLHRLLPATARISVLGLVAFAMWWTWPRNDDHNSFVNDARAGDPAALAVVNPANVALSGAAVLAAPTIAPDAT